MMNLSEQVRALKETLNSLGDVSALDNIKDKLVTEQAALEALQKQRLAEETKIEELRRRAEAEWIKHQHVMEVARNERAVELQKHGKIMEAGQAVLTDLKDNIVKARTQHDSISAEVESLKKRFG